jgi:hypothetical protein
MTGRASYPQVDARPGDLRRGVSTAWASLVGRAQGPAVGDQQGTPSRSLSVSYSQTPLPRPAPEESIARPGAPPARAAPGSSAGAVTLTASPANPRAPAQNDLPRRLHRAARVVLTIVCVLSIAGKKARRPIVGDGRSARQADTLRCCTMTFGRRPPSAVGPTRCLPGGEAGRPIPNSPSAAGPACRCRATDLVSLLGRGPRPAAAQAGRGSGERVR